MAKRKKMKVFQELKAALAESLRYEQGQPANLGVTEIPPPPKPMSPAKIREIRVSLDISQARFAQFLNVSANTVESWEQGKRNPQNAALKLLNIARKRPEVLLEP